MLACISAGLAAVGNLVAGAVSAIGSAIATVGPTVCKFAKGVVEVFSKIPGGLNTVLNVVDKVVGGVNSSMGVQCDDNSIELGYKAMHSDVKPEDFDSTQEYIEYLSREVAIDKETFGKLSEADSLGNVALGLALQTRVISEKLGTAITPECLGTLAKVQIARSDYTPALIAAGQQPTFTSLDPDQLVNLIRSLKAQGINNLNDVSELLEGRGESDRVKTAHAFVDAIGANGEEKLEQLQDEVSLGTEKLQAGQI